MGLDQCAYLRSDEDNPEPTYVWRKHAQLQTFMENLFTAKTGQNAASLNSNELLLTSEDVAKLAGLIAEGRLPQSDGGFFYGHQFQDEAAEEYADQDAAFCAWAKAQITAGETVIYSCWW